MFLRTSILTIILQIKRAGMRVYGRFLDFIPLTN